MSEKLNELRKATMASYLAKAGKVIRADTSIAASFDADYGKHLAQANKHHPNMVTPHFEKDPEKLAHHEKQMNVNAELRDTFKRSAANRIKGIALAGRRLAKEEVINEKNTESHPELWATHELRHESGKALKKGDVVKDFRGDKHKIKGFELPHHSGSTGRVYTNQGSFFPSVVDAKIVRKREPVLARQARRGQVGEEVEQVNEVSRSVIAKVATARYNQAQDALKKKDFGGYVKKMGKAIKASDATTPKTGWSPEDDGKKNEEVVPVLSAQEKYRQIKEARLAKAQKSTTTHHNYYVAHDELGKASKALKKAGIPHSVADHSKASVDHSVVSVRHKHTGNADAALNKAGVDFGGR